MTTAVRYPEMERVKQDLDDLAKWRDADQPGWTRMALTTMELESRQWVKQLMSAAGLEVTIDPIGNIIGRLPGTGVDRRAIVVGSHTDTVEGGGRFDGIVGVLGAVEVVRLLRESGIALKHDLLVIDFYNEEANRFELSCLGSRFLAGNLSQEHLRRVDFDGRPLADVLGDLGVSVEDLQSSGWSRDHVLGYLELHIEQGPILENANATVGVVTSIAGIARFRAAFRGRRDHAGTMPMSLRQDAGCAAAGLVLGVERICNESSSTVGTVGEMVLTPAATSIVSESAVVSAEIRSPDAAWIAQAREEIDAVAALEASRRGVGAATEWFPWEKPVSMDDRVSTLISRSIADLGHEGMRLYSGAGHDAVQMARLGPTGMIFVPSAAGRSHCPEEWTEVEDICVGIHVLARSIVTLDSGER